MGWWDDDPKRGARSYLAVARDLREERQAIGDKRDNGDASCLQKAAELRRAAQAEKGGR